MSTIRRIPPPTDSRLAADYAAASHTDAFAIHLKDEAPDDAVALSRAVLEQPPGWFRVLLGIRDAAVKPLGLKTSSAMRAHLAANGIAHVGMFRVLSSTPEEVVFGEQDKHLDFKLSILIRRPAGAAHREAVATTTVRCHNLLGRFYLAAIMPGHVLAVKSHLAAAAKLHGVS